MSSYLDNKSFVQENFRSVLLRRLSLDLTGLPPTVTEVATFEADTDPRAYEPGEMSPPLVRLNVQLLSELVKRLGVAEVMQWRLRRQPLGVEDWRKIAGEDTGSMFEVCACLGTRSDQLRRFGALLGMLYHGCDDVGDVRGAVALGGGGKEDLRDGILTLMYYVELYLKLARTQHPDDYAEIIGDPGCLAKN